ncbi:MAG: protein kinase, partial [Akkermansiaceae bacterium]|nr:protein kinase [Akkermansiaceae bacterium]
MSLPEIPGYRIETLIGKGACGSVYTARHESGGLVAVKLLDRRSCNPALIANRVNRLYRSSAPKAAVPLIAHSLEKEPILLIGALLADRMVKGIGERFIPRTLQLRLGDFLGKRGSWLLIRRLAQVLSEFHRRRVAHGNLKPGNIFLDAENEVLLSDYAQGLMPGILELPYTDALLYAPPEQLTNPDGYLEGAGYGWDVYAFGVLAFRLLNGIFPRCHKTFERVAPALGEQRRRGVEADCERIARELEKTSLAEWGGTPPTREEEEGRQIIERCLSLDPWERFSDMAEVLRALEAVASSRQQRLAREADEERVADIERRSRGWRTAAGLG